eukprot:Pompholyxophrys_punicea_v1_NODE_25_length_5265_cov_107.938388.p6 type:complete len:154 gc:universal NODE_25_length_5265_cov_107.938388:1321-860(-)
MQPGHRRTPLTNLNNRIQHESKVSIPSTGETPTQYQRNNSTQHPPLDDTPQQEQTNRITIKQQIRKPKTTNEITEENTPKTQTTFNPAKSHPVLHHTQRQKPPMGRPDRNKTRKLVPVLLPERQRNRSSQRSIKTNRIRTHPTHHASRLLRHR